jgi:hypothetical protein
MELGSQIHPVYRYLEYDEVVESINALDFIYLNKFPAKYLDKRMHELFAATKLLMAHTLGESNEIERVFTNYPQISFSTEHCKSVIPIHGGRALVVED